MKVTFLLLRCYSGGFLVAQAFFLRVRVFWFGEREGDRELCVDADESNYFERDSKQKNKKVKSLAMDSLAPPIVLSLFRNWAAVDESLKKLS